MMTNKLRKAISTPLYCSVNLLRVRSNKSPSDSRFFKEPQLISNFITYASHALNELP
jgi:hypothetical protein